LPHRRGRVPSRERSTTRSAARWRAGRSARVVASFPIAAVYFLCVVVLEPPRDAIPAHPPSSEHGEFTLRDGEMACRAFDKVHLRRRAVLRIVCALHAATFVHSRCRPSSRNSTREGAAPAYSLVLADTLFA